MDILKGLPDHIIKLMEAQQKYFNVNMNKSLKNQREIEAQQCMFEHTHIYHMQESGCEIVMSVVKFNLKNTTCSEKIAIFIIKFCEEHNVCM